MKSTRLQFSIIKACLLILLIGGASSETSAAEPTWADVAYGTHQRQRLDLWLADSHNPTPLIIYIHGGGFMEGDKSRVRGNPVIDLCQKRGVSYAAINYRFLTTVPIQTILRDAARAVQFLRANAARYNLDSTRFAAYGGSAGAGTSLWLAMHNDLADLNSPDPVLRQSTRLTAAASIAGQFTYDLMQWPATLDFQLNQFTQPIIVCGFYGFPGVDVLDSDAGKAIRADVDMYGAITADDPPVYLTSSHPGGQMKTLNDLYHHPRHMEAFKARCDAVGVPAVLDLPRVENGQTVQPARNGAVEFLIQQLLKKGPPAMNPVLDRGPLPGVQPAPNAQNKPPAN